VDVYIDKSAEFARPTLAHLRDLVHRACPGVVEEIKWSRPSFVYQGKILFGMAAFKEHCVFSFWGAEIGNVLKADGAVEHGAMGTFGRIETLRDIPPDRKMLGYLKQAAAFVDEGKGETFMAVSRRVVKVPKAAIESPPDFVAALKKSKAATKVFEGFSPSCTREYLEWILEAKRPETRERRIAQAVEWIAERKQRNWKYQSC
jgi:uncharacterized protein YdeI (YjbR/CyaY-like superfamily)